MSSMRLRPQPPAIHGGAGLGIDLSASLNPLGPSIAALEAARGATFDCYPEPEAGSLRRAAARRHSLEEAAVVAVPGAGFGLWLVMLALLQPGDRCVALAPCFGEYRRAAAIAQAGYEDLAAGEPTFEWDLGQVDAQLAAGAGMCVLANPANPSGRAIEAERIRNLCHAHPETTFLVDEAFAAFGPPGISLLDDGNLPGNAIVVRSLTKELGLPGLRMGYLVARPDLARRIGGVMPPWPLSSPSLEAAVAGMSELDHVEAGARLARIQIEKLDSAFREAGLVPIPTDANYLLVRAPGALGSFGARGITVRDCASFGLPDYVRIAAPTVADLPHVLAAIRALELT